jgi:hypothetical protein
MVMELILWMKRDETEMLMSAQWMLFKSGENSAGVNEARAILTPSVPDRRLIIKQKSPLSVRSLNIHSGEIITSKRRCSFSL